MHRLVFVLAFVALDAGALAHALASGKERIFVLSQAGAALTEIAVVAGKPGASIALDKAPAAVALTPDGGVAYVTHPDGAKVSVVDMARRRVVSTFAVPGSPFGIAVSRTGRLYVADWNGAHVAVLDRAGVQSATISVGRAPAHVLLTRDEKRLFVANRESDSVSVVRTADNVVEATIPVGRAPFAMALSPDGAHLYVGNVQAGTVSVVDTATLAVTETPSSAMPYGAAVTPDGTRVLVTNQQAGTVAVIGSSDAIRTIKVGAYPEGIAVSTDGRRAYVANWFSDDVSVLDLETLTEIRRIECPAGPRGIVAMPAKP
jgi:YVTN family beta-propeller protein